MYGGVRGNGWYPIVLIVLALALPSAARASDAWSGATTSSHWSVTGNWAGGVAPGGAAGTLTFPDLGGCAAPLACYSSDNDLPGVTASGLVFSNITGGGYNVVGNALTVGAAGITDAAGHSTTATLNTPLTLSAAQRWAIGGTNGYNDLSLAPPATVRGSSALSVAFPPGGYGDLFVASDIEVGPVTVTGVGGLHIGGPTIPGSVNGTDGQPVVLRSGGLLVANPGATVGPLSLSGGSLLLGTGPSNNKTTTLSVSGGASLASATATTTYVNDNGATPGVDFSQLSASGNISLGGVLNVEQAPRGATCVPLARGDVATLVFTTGTLSGTFSNAPNGAIVTMPSSCQATATEVQIAYTADRVTATVLSGTTPTATALAPPRPSPAVTNQPVTLSATVSTLTDSPIAPAGTVAFLDRGSPIAGCGGQALSGNGSTATATCVTTFAAVSSPEALTATFSGAPGSEQAGSSGAPQSLTVNRDATTAAVATSRTRTRGATRVTYTATVTPGHPGANRPSGMVRFSAGGRPIAGCGGRALTVRSSSSTATCTVPYRRRRSGWIAARYSGDRNFTSSSSALSATTGTATGIGTTRATFNGSISPGGAAVTWQFEYGRGRRYDQRTRPAAIAAGHAGPIPVSRTVTRLSPNARYHVRLVISTRFFGPVAIVDLKPETFTTRATGRLLVASSRLTVIGHAILVSASCRSDRRCHGRLSITTTTSVSTNHHRRPATVLCTTTPFTIAAPGHATVKSRITRACLALLKRNRHHQIIATLTARLRTGQHGLLKRIALALH